MTRMKDKLSRFDRWMAAITFAESGDPEMALELTNQRRSRKPIIRPDRRTKSRADDRPVLRA